MGSEVFRFVCFFREWGLVVLNQHFELIAMALGTFPQTKMFSFWHCPKRGSCPNLLVLLQECIFGQLRESISSKMSIIWILNWYLGCLYEVCIFSPRSIFKLKMCFHDCVWGLLCVYVCLCASVFVYVCMCECVYVCARKIKTVQMVQPRHSSSSQAKRARCTGAGCLKNGPRKVGEICST